jgi:hypothetical protein
MSGKYSDAIKIEGAAPNDGQVLTWDQVSIKPSDESLELGLDVLTKLPTRSITIYVDAGSMAAMEVEVYGSVEEVMAKIPESLRKEIRLTEPAYFKDEYPQTTVYRCPLSKLVVEAFPPFSKQQDTEGDDQLEKTENA